MTWILISIPFMIAGLLVAIGPVIFGLFQQEADDRTEAAGRLAQLPEADSVSGHKVAA